MKSYVFISGACGGLGKAFCYECASRGWDLFITDISQTALNTLSCSLKSDYAIEVVSCPCDYSHSSSREDLFEYIQTLGLSFWFLINVAGLDYEGRFTDRDRLQLRTLLRVNIEGTLDITRGLLDHRDCEIPFRIITVSSLAAFYPMPFKAMYAASKRFLLDFFRALKEELKSSGGTVTVLCPAGMPTTPEMVESIKSQGIIGVITTKDVGFIARRTVDKTLAGRSLYIPGFFNRVLRVLGGLFTSGFAARTIRRRWIATYKKMDKPPCDVGQGTEVESDEIALRVK